MGKIADFLLLHVPNETLACLGSKPDFTVQWLDWTQDRLTCRHCDAESWLQRGQILPTAFDDSFGPHQVNKSGEQAYSNCDVNQHIHYREFGRMLSVTLYWNHRLDVRNWVRRELQMNCTFLLPLIAGGSFFSVLKVSLSQTQVSPLYDVRS